MMKVDCLGYQDYFFENFDEVISVKRPKVQCTNILFGTRYLDFNDSIKVINHRTQEYAEIKFHLR